MAVKITGLKKKPRAATVSNSDIRAAASEIVERQAAGRITSRDLADELNKDGVPAPGGRRWNHTLVFIILTRGKSLGLPFILRSRSDATSARRVIRRCKDVIQAERAVAMKKLLAAVQAASASDPAITSSPIDGPRA